MSSFPPTRRGAPPPGGLRQAIRAVPALLAVLLLLGPVALAAQERGPAETIRSDRPGLGDGAWVLPHGVRQVELGATFQDAGSDGFVSGAALVRWGLPPVELRIFLPALVVSRSEDDLALDDLGIGVKLPLVERDGWSWAVTSALTLPTSTAESASNDVVGSAAAVAETALTGTLGLAINAGYAFPFDGPDDGTLSVLVTPGIDLGGGKGAYAGYAAFLRPGDDAHYLEAGFTSLADADTQLDLNLGYDVSTDAWFLGVGLARRWR